MSTQGTDNWMCTQGILGRYTHNPFPISFTLHTILHGEYTILSIILGIYIYLLYVCVCILELNATFMSTCTLESYSCEG